MRGFPARGQNAEGDLTNLYRNRLQKFFAHAKKFLSAHSRQAGLPLRAAAQAVRKAAIRIEAARKISPPYAAGAAGRKKARQDPDGAKSKQARQSSRAFLVCQAKYVSGVNVQSGTKVCERVERGHCSPCKVKAYRGMVYPYFSSNVYLFPSALPYCFLQPRSDLFQSNHELTPPNKLYEQCSQNA